MCCMELGSMGCNEIALAKNYTMLHQALDFAPWSCDSAYQMLFSSAMVRMEKLSSNCLQHRSSSCDSAYEMLFSVAPEIPWMEVQSFIMEHHGSSSKAAPPVKATPPHPPPDITPPLAPAVAARDSQWLWARPRACTTSGSTVMVQCCTSHSRYRATGSQ